MINEADFLVTLNDIFRSELDDDNIHLTMATEQADILTWDSLAHVRIMMSVERAFNVQFEAEEIESVTTVRGFFGAVRNHMG